MLFFKGICNKGIFSANAWSSKNVPELFSCPEVAASKCNAETMCDLQQHREKINHLKTKKEPSIFSVKTLYLQTKDMVFHQSRGIAKIPKKNMSVN